MEYPGGDYGLLEFRNIGSILNSEVVVHRGIARRTCRSTESAAKKWARFCGQRQIVLCYWAFFKHIGRQAIGFAISPALTRLLAPEEFGLIGMLVIFMPLAQALFDSGFDVAAISK